jgi:hypothetical protein
MSGAMAASAVLLLESEETVIKDVTCSLRLVDVPVIAFWDVAEAKRVAVERRPALILARARIRGDDQAGASLAMALAGEKLLDEMPVVVLYTQGEKELVESQRSFFFSEIGLPVEFPYFTNRVRNIMEEIRTRSQRAAGPESAAGKGALGVGKIEGRAETGLAGEKDRRNMLIAYDIQLRVLDQLKRGDILSKVGEHQVPGIVESVTHQICAAFDKKGFLSH